MNCLEVSRLMDPYLDGELDETAAGEMTAHLAGCGECRRTWGGLVTLLHEPAPVEVPAALRNRIVASLERQTLLTTKPLQSVPAPLHRWYRGLRYAGALAACMTLFVSGWMVSGWWTASHPASGVAQLPPPPQAPATVVVSPWMMSSWAQAMVMPGPISPAVMLVQGVAPEMLLLPPTTDEPTIRRRLTPDDSATQPAEPLSPELHILPLGPRYLGA